MQEEPMYKMAIGLNELQQLLNTHFQKEALKTATCEDHQNYLRESADVLDKAAICGVSTDPLNPLRLFLFFKDK